MYTTYEIGSYLLSSTNTLPHGTINESLIQSRYLDRTCGTTTSRKEIDGTQGSVGRVRCGRRAITDSSYEQAPPSTGDGMTDLGVAHHHHPGDC